MKLAKSYWSPVCCSTERDRSSIKSWFGILCKEMTPEKAEILCDTHTDREKKIRALMVDKDGKRRWAIRTLGGKTYSVTLKAVGYAP